jgi:DNA-directed RNA polymerase subunit K/omega
MGIDTIRQIDRLDAVVGGRFKLTALLQRRIQEVVKGSPRLIEGKTPLRSALAEIEAGKIEMVEVEKPSED